MDRGYTWFALNNDTTDYLELSRALSRSIKKYNRHNAVCVITDKPLQDDLFDHVVVLRDDASKDQKWKLNNEYKVFRLTPFTHTIKLEADMMFTQGTDWWWNHLWQHDQVFSYHCRDYQDRVVTDSYYRRLFIRNHLPDVYNGLHYFRRSRRAKQFFDICEFITNNWPTIKSEVLINCHDQQPTTDVVYGLANRMQDPLQLHKVDYEWFKFMHNKQHINGLHHDNNDYLNPMATKDRIYIGGYRQDRVVHYHDKALKEKLDV